MRQFIISLFTQKDGGALYIGNIFDAVKNHKLSVALYAGIVLNSGKIQWSFYI